MQRGCTAGVAGGAGMGCGAGVIGCAEWEGPVRTAAQREEPRASGRAWRRWDFLRQMRAGSCCAAQKGEGGLWSCAGILENGLRS
jgi:hypothetical protein